MEYSAALKRIQGLRGHVSRAHVVEEEISKATFDIDEARKAFWDIIPDVYFKGHEIAAELKNLE